MKTFISAQQSTKSIATFQPKSVETATTHLTAHWYKDKDGRLCRRWFKE